MEPNTSGDCFDPDDIYDFFKEAWAKNRQVEEEKLKDEAELHPENDSETADAQEDEGESSRRPKTTANRKALKVTCELLRVFVSEAVQRAGLMAEIEGLKEIDCSHLEQVATREQPSNNNPSKI